jgi:hypothetical protein
VSGLIDAVVPAAPRVEPAIPQTRRWRVPFVFGFQMQFGSAGSHLAGADARQEDLLMDGQHARHQGRLREVANVSLLQKGRPYFSYFSEVLDFALLILLTRGLSVHERAFLMRIRAHEGGTMGSKLHLKLKSKSKRKVLNFQLCLCALVTHSYPRRRG